LEEILRYLFIFQHKGKRFTINNQHLIELVFDICPMLAPLLFVLKLTYFHIGLGGLLKATRAADALGSLHFVTCDHPYFYISSSQTLNSCFKVSLEFVLDACDAKKCYTMFQLMHKFFNLFLIDFQLIVSFFILMGPFFEKFSRQNLPRKNQSSQSTHRQIFTLLLNKGLFLSTGDKLFHSCICSLQVEYNFIILLVLQNDSHSFGLAFEREGIFDLVLDSFAAGDG